MLCYASDYELLFLATIVEEMHLLVFSKHCQVLIFFSCVIELAVY